MSTNGLMGVVVADTVCSRVDGERGELVIAGFDIEDLAGVASFESVVDLLWTGALTDGAARRASLGAARARAFTRLPGLIGALRHPNGMVALRGALATLDETDPEALLAQVGVCVAAWMRLRVGEEPVAPDPSLGHAADMLRMGTGGGGAAADALDAYLVTVMDHGLNASTFTARVVASTGSDTVSAVVAAIGALKGPLHGGAPGPVLDMLDAIGSPDQAAAWIHSELQSGRRIMGMGHRIYRVRDPRAAVLEAAIARLAEAGVAQERLALARSVEASAEAALAARHPERPLKCNVEFYTAVLLDAIGLPREGFAAMFAVGRTVGWLAHIDEQRRTGKLVRPDSRYIGPEPTHPDRSLRAG